MPKHSAYLDIDRDAGVEKIFHRLHDGDWVVEMKQDCQAILDANAEMRNHVDQSGSFQRLAARIPNSIAVKWLWEEGIDCWSSDPDMKRRIEKKLNDPEWRYLRCDNSRL